MNQIIFIDTATGIISVDEPSDYSTRVQHEILIGEGSHMVQLKSALDGYTKIPAAFIQTQNIPAPILKVIFV